MTTTAFEQADQGSARPVDRGDDFVVLASDHALGESIPHKLGRVLWGPMFAMALMAFVVGFIVSIVRADEIASGGNADTIAALGHLVPGFMFLGFAAVFAAISFAIARILSAFRRGGGEVQEAAGAAEVQTLDMPWTARAFIGGMMMAMMVILAAVVLHFVAAGALFANGEDRLVNGDVWAARLEAVRRIGVAAYLLAISLGLASIVTVLRFQAVRIRQLVR